MDRTGQQDGTGRGRKKWVRNRISHSRTTAHRMEGSSHSHNSKGVCCPTRVHDSSNWARAMVTIAVRDVHRIPEVRLIIKHNRMLRRSHSKYNPHHLKPGIRHRNIRMPRPLPTPLRHSIINRHPILHSRTERMNIIPRMGNLRLRRHSQALSAAAAVPQTTTLSARRRSRSPVKRKAILVTFSNPDRSASCAQRATRCRARQS